MTTVDSAGFAIGVLIGLLVYVVMVVVGLVLVVSARRAAGRARRHAADPLARGSAPRRGRVRLVVGVLLVLVGSLGLVSSCAGVFVRAVGG